MTVRKGSEEKQAEWMSWMRQGGEDSEERVDDEEGDVLDSEEQRTETGQEER